MVLVTELLTLRGSSLLLQQALGVEGLWLGRERVTLSLERGYKGYSRTISRDLPEVVRQEMVRDNEADRRSRQNGWLGTRVRESQMTCACVRLTTSTEVVHRNHKDRRGASWQPRRTPKGNKLTSLLKEPALLLREPAQSQMPILSKS